MYTPMSSDEFYIAEATLSYGAIYNFKVNVPIGFSGTVDIYHTYDIVNGPWEICDVGIPVESGQAVWKPFLRTLETMRKVRNGGTHFFRAENGSLDSDGDGYPDMYELLVLGTDPLVADSVTPGISDGPAWPGGSIQAGPAPALIQADAFEPDPLASGTLAIYNPRAAEGFGFASSYASIAIAGTFNGWSTVGNPLTLVADHQWEAVIFVDTNNPEFKFAANGNWDVNWGQVGSASYPLPMTNTALQGNSSQNIKISGTMSGNLKFTFCETSMVYTVEETDDPVTPPPPPPPTSPLPPPFAWKKPR
jgi:hypothetical protein